MKHYRLLNPGERMEDGDEEYSSDELMDDVTCPVPCWRPVSITFVGEVVQEAEALDPPVRREFRVIELLADGWAMTSHRHLVELEAAQDRLAVALTVLKTVVAQSLIDYRAGKQTSGMYSTVATVIQTIEELEET